MPRTLMMNPVGAIDDGILQIEDEPIAEKSLNDRQNEGMGGKTHEFEIIKQWGAAHVKFLNRNQGISTEFSFLLTINAVYFLPPSRQFRRRKQAGNYREPANRDLFGISGNFIADLGLLNTAIRTLLQASLLSVSR